MSPPFDLEIAIDEATQQAIAETEIAFSLISDSLTKARDKQNNGIYGESVKHYGDAFWQLLQSEIPSDYFNAMSYRTGSAGISLEHCGISFEYRQVAIAVHWENLKLGVPWCVSVGGHTERRCEKGRLLVNLLQIFGDIRNQFNRTEYRVERESA